MPPARTHRTAVALLLACAALCVSSTAIADKLITKDGATYNGRLIERSDETIRFEVKIGERRLVRDFKASDVLELTLDKPQPPQPPGKVEKTLDKQALATLMASTALVDAGLFGSGTAFCVGEDGMFLTNRHVVDEVGAGGMVTLVLNPTLPSEKVLKAKVISVGEKVDLALLRVATKEKFTPLPLGTLDGIEVTSQTTALGFPFGRWLAADKKQ